MISHQVFSSFMLQSGIAILAFSALLSFELRSIYTGESKKPSKRKNEGKETHTDRIAIALVEFHKAQCYFSSVIQITALSLFRQRKKAGKSFSYGSPANTYNDFFDTSVLIVLATGGLIPINLTLSCLTRYGRQSWYLLILSLITSTLATSTLISSYYNANQSTNKDDFNNNLQFPFSYSTTYGGTYNGNCVLGSENISHIVVPLCGNSELVNNAMPSGTVANWWTWLVWTNCMTWLFFCLGKKCYETENLGSYRERLKSFLTSRWLNKFVVREYDAHTMWIATAVIPWFLCFASQFWLFSAYFQHSVISYQWSFGQIITITIWVPCLVEYLYIELSKLYSPGF